MASVVGIGNVLGFVRDSFDGDLQIYKNAIFLLPTIEWVEARDGDVHSVVLGEEEEEIAMSWGT